MSGGKLQKTGPQAIVPTPPEPRLSSDSGDEIKISVSRGTLRRWGPVLAALVGGLGGGGTISTAVRLWRTPDRLEALEARVGDLAMKLDRIGERLGVAPASQPAK